MLIIDFESRSRLELGGSKSCGLHRYCIDDSTQILMLGWTYDNNPPEIWEPHLGPMPAELREGLEDPEVRIMAFNSAFERGLLKYKLGLDIPVSRFEDPQPSARYLSLPSSLEEVSEILGLPQDLSKDKQGKRLIDLFSKIHKKRKKKDEPVQEYFPDWNSHPEDWELFKSYCKQDIISEREVLRRLKLLQVWPLPPSERRIWEFDQLVNSRGLPVDTIFVRKALSLAEREKQEAIDAQNKLTGLDNANSNTQMLAWAKQHGYARTTLAKGAVDGQLKYNKDLDEDCRKALEARKTASSTTYKKLAAILRLVSPDNRLRNQFVFMGSSRCGRFAGNGLQFHNLARPIQLFENEDNINIARQLIRNEDYDGIRRQFGSVLSTIKSNIRTAFVAEPGNRFNISDLSAIETRVAAWLAECQPLLNVFYKKHDPYLDLAVNMTGIPYETLAADIKSKDPQIKAKAKGYRQIAKSGILGCVYGLSGGQMGADKHGDPIKLGLAGYAEASGTEMSFEQAHEVVKVFRESYKEIVEFWYAIEQSIKDVLDGERTIRELGPNGCVKIDKFVFTCSGNMRTLLRIALPSGRRLHYLDAHITETKMPWKRDGEDVYRPTFCYAGQDQTTKQWTTITSRGAKVFENLVQAISRDILCEKLLMFEEAGLSVVGHVHDEGIAETADDPFCPGGLEMEHIMSLPVAWAPGLPLAAEAFESQFYKK